MSAAAVTVPVKVAKKKTASSSKPKKVADHPKYAEMVKDALTNLKVLHTFAVVLFRVTTCL